MEVVSYLFVPDEVLCTAMPPQKLQLDPRSVTTE